MENVHRICDFIINFFIVIFHFDFYILNYLVSIFSTFP